MITIKTQGGLGNQMFQYAFGRALSISHNLPLALDTSLFKTYPHHAYGLNRYDLPVTLTEDSAARAFVRMKPKMGRRHLLHNTFFADPERYIIEPSFHFDPRMQHAKDGLYFDGYWQSERYFEAYGDTIRADFTLRTPVDNVTLKLRETMLSQNAISLHVRRGLYVTSPVFSAVHGACGPEYFDKALSHITSRVPDPHVYVFSDDQQWAREHIRPDFPTTYVDHTTSETPHEDIFLMSSCKHHIIANSTFSWWGAWLNPSKEKIVVGPKKWFNQEKYNTTDVMPPSWTRL
ncbi:MAG: hypothetical protein RLZZ234_182 [Candidatus Parcubacteria bacterium]|jgi:hypothetical protein